MAAPHVTAALALLSRRIGKLTPTDAKEALRQSSDSVSGMNGETFTPGYGYGRLNLTRLMQL
jgi:hypothetical protein